MARGKSEPAVDLTFRAVDFARFRPELQRNPEYNAERLEVRRKLEAIGKHLRAALEEGGGPSLTSRASLHHPYRFNSFAVESQWVYLSRSDKERRGIQRILGVELGKDLDQNYVHTLLVLEIHERGLETALRIHKDAWWDGENLKRKLAHAEERERFAGALRAAPAHGLRIHDYRNIHACATITAEELKNTFQYYKPGEHWLHVARSIAKDDPFIAEPGFVERLTAEFRSLLPAYHAIAWTDENNFLFTKDE